MTTTPPPHVGRVDASVLVVGAGPVGLMLAGELRLGGVDVVVVERRDRPSEESRGLGFTARAAEILDQRGLLHRCGDVEVSRQGHFGGIPLDFGLLDGAHFGVRGVPQHRVEAVLERWAAELGATILRGTELTGLEYLPDRVVADVTGPSGPFALTARYLVGCDGGRSTVRGLAGFAFPGTDATREMYLADVVGAGIRPRFIGERVPGGMVMSAPLEPGVDRIIVCPREAPHRTRDRAPSFDEVADAWESLTGESLHGAGTRWVSVFTDATRQVDGYRRGRVLLAGDAAHVHLPAGGQGLSLGVQDAVNLGWKLAATVRGDAPPDLLDTYDTERRPVGARVLRNTLAQGHLYLSGSEVEPLRAVTAELLALPEVARVLIGMVSGFDVRYDVGPGDHPWLGARLRPLRFGGSPAAERLHAGHGVLFDPTGVLVRSTSPWAGRVDPVVGAPGQGWPSRTAVLVRPDGYVAWAGDSAAGLPTALRRWFGAPDPSTPDTTTPQEELTHVQHADRRPDGPGGARVGGQAVHRVRQD